MLFTVYELIGCFESFKAWTCCNVFLTFPSQSVVFLKLTHNNFFFLFFYSGTKETIDLTNQMAEKGAHAALVVTPAFFKSRMNSEAMLRHYTHVSIMNHIGQGLFLF